jgi:hypothetical protein
MSTIALTLFSLAMSAVFLWTALDGIATRLGFGEPMAPEFAEDTSERIPGDW